MSFYQQLSKYYDIIFPASPETVEFLMQAAGEAPKRVMDIACGSGEYSSALAQKGYTVHAVDYDEAMVDKAREKLSREGLQAEVQQGDMRTLEMEEQEPYDLVFCIGNSLVHLGSLEDMALALAHMRKLLSAEGKLILQVINYDRIRNHGISALPPIHNAARELEFVRNYRWDTLQQKIYFDTVLTVGSGSQREVYENSIPLYPLYSEDMKKILETAGFLNYRFYGDFLRGAFTDASYLLVVEAEKDNIH